MLHVAAKDLNRGIAGPAQALRRQPWYANYRYQSAVLSLLTAAMVIWWW